MKLRNLTLIAGLLGAFFTNSVFALGMGEIKLNSSLNEPLDAEIQLLNIGDLTELEMLVGLGSREDFKAAGVERLFLLTDLRFKVDMSEPGNPILRVTSRKPIREPYLDFLLELQWPSGRLLREYTLLLDLPVYATERASAKKIKAASVSPQPKPQQQAPVASSPTTSSSATTSTRSTSRAPAPSNSSATNGGEYRVAPGDTAWGIAKKIKPEDASIMQSLAAVKQSNPHAFINGNINLLKKGAVLRIPSSSDISQLSSQEVKEQVDFSPESAIAEKKSSQPQLDATSAAINPQSAPVADGGGRLKLAVPSDDEGGSSANASGGSASGSADGSVSRGTEKLESEFAVFQEELDKTQRENAELKARLSNMEEQLATMSRLVEINDDSLRAAQQVASQEQQTTQEDVSKEIATEEKTSLQAASKTSEADTDQGSSEEQSSTEEQAAKTPAASDSDTNESNKGQDVATGSATTDKEGGFDLQYWVDLLLYPFIFVLAILLAIVLFFKNRKQDEEPQEELSLQTLVEKEAVDEDDTEEVLNEEDKQVLEEAVSELDEQELKNLEELELTEGEDVDPVGEADIYLSLGNYKQAESVLLDAINEAPDDAALRLKLLEVYVSSNELDKFDAQYAQFSALSDADAIVKADSLRAELVSDPVVDSLEEDSVTAEEKTLEEEPLDIGADTEAEIAKLDEELSLDDVDLDLDSETASSNDEAVEESVSSTSDFDLDLDLESVDLGVDAKEPSEAESPESESSELENSELDNIDLDTLASDIDAGMESIDLDVSEEVDPLDSSLDDLSDTISETIPEAASDISPEASTGMAEENTSDDFEDFDDDLDVLAGEDECSTKLELAQAYLDMGDPESAREILDEVVSLGDDAQQEQARKLLEGVT